MREIKDFFPDYHDGEFLAPKSGAKLASLFGLDQTESHGNETFKFTAPKQPKKQPTSSLGLPPLKPSLPQSILLAVAVYAFRFVNGQYVRQGNLGAAILGNHVTKEYKILLYGSQKKQLTTARIHHGFVLTLQPGNYTAFYDDQQQIWSLTFASENGRMDFFKEVCVARWNSQTCMDMPVTQDLVHGEGHAVVMGDTVKMTFSGWLFQNHAIGPLFDSNVRKDKLQRVKLGSAKALRGWEKEMLGMQKGGRRLIIIPPSMTSGSKGVPKSVPPTSTLVFEVEIQQIKCLVSEGSLSGGSFDSLTTSPVPALDNEIIDCAAQSATCIAPELGDQVSQDKCRPLNDLPKEIGEPGPAAPTSSSAQSVSSKPVNIQHPEATNEHILHKAYSTSQIQPFASNFPHEETSYLSMDVSSFLITEARQHNTEIRLSVSRLTDKVDYLVSKVDEIQKHGVCSYGLAGVSLETAMILHNIQTIIQENVVLKKEVLQRDSRVEEQNRKLGELIEQRYVEQNSLEPRNKVLQNGSQYNLTQLLQADQEKVPLAEELGAASSSVCELQLEAGHLQQRVAELQAKLNAALQEGQRRSTQISYLDAQVEELGNEAAHIQQQWRAEKQKSRKSELTVKRMEDEIQDLRTDNESLEQMMSNRKRKWQQERERLLFEQEEQHGSTDQAKQQLRKARVPDEAQIRQQVELEWQRRSDAALEEQRGTLEGVITELQKQLQKVLVTGQQPLDEQLEVQVKRVMNQLFHYLRTEFDLQESYTGESVLENILNSIKYVTMRFLGQLKSEGEDEEDEEYVTTEEAQSDKEERTGMSRVQSEDEEQSQLSLDQTYVTADETVLIGASSSSD